MRAEGHISIAKAEVRGRELARHFVRRLANGKAWAASGALGRPRAWSYATQAALDGFERGLAEDGLRGAPRLDAALRESRRELVGRVNDLIERDVPDATLIGLLLQDGDLHVVTAGPGRVYLHRKGEPQRLTPRDDPPVGLLEAKAATCTVRLDPGDLLMAGSVSAFSTRAIGRVASVLERDSNTPPSVLATLLTEPAAKAGVGAVAVVLRIR